MRIKSQSLKGFSRNQRPYLQFQKTRDTDEEMVEFAINDIRKINGLELIPKDE